MMGEGCLLCCVPALANAYSEHDADVMASRAFSNYKAVYLTYIEWTVVFPKRKSNTLRTPHTDTTHSSGRVQHDHQC